MKKLIKVCLSAVLLAAVFAGCRTTTIHNVQSNVFTPMEESKISMGNIERAIIRAGAGLGWQMKKVKEGEIIGILMLRSHVAKVKIPYNTKDYSILYMDSTNLNYDADANTIHSNYNGWIQNLNNAIQVQVNTL